MDELTEDEGLEQCWNCANKVVSKGYYGSRWEPPTDPELCGCRAHRRNGGTMPCNKYAESEDIPLKLCAWYVKQFPTEKARIRCPVCNSPKWVYVDTEKGENTSDDDRFEEYEETIKCEHCGAPQKVPYSRFWGDVSSE